MKRAFAISSVAHVAFLVLIVLPGFQRTQIAITQVMNVKLVEAPKPAKPKVRPQATKPKPTVPESRTKSKMAFKPKTTTRKSKPEESKPEESKPKETPKPETETQKPEPEPKAGTSPTVRVDEKDFRFAYYLEIIRERVSQNWSPPPATGSGAGVLSTVYFRISRDGRVSDVTVEQPSGFDLFDRAALRAVTLSSPLPPLPAGFKGRWLGVHFEFQQTPG